MKLAIAIVLAVALAGCGVPTLVKNTYNSIVDPGCDWFAPKQISQDEYQQLQKTFGKPIATVVQADHRTETYAKGNTTVVVEVRNGQPELVTCKSGK
ncbi:MAG: hypothetical protein QW561_03350 [Candidatus Aenigmatarchaeota archaeon]